MGGCGYAIFAVLAEVEQGVAELTVQGDLIAASEFNAGEVETFGREAGVVVGVGGRGGLRERFAGEALPSQGEFKLGLMFGVGLRGVEVADILFLSGQLKFNESGFSGDYTGFTEGDGGELVDEGGFEGIGRAEAEAESVEMGLEGAGVVEVKKYVIFGGEAVFEGISGRDGLAFGGSGAF